MTDETVGDIKDYTSRSIIFRSNNVNKEEGMTVGVVRFGKCLTLNPEENDLKKKKEVRQSCLYHSL